MPKKMVSGSQKSVEGKKRIILFAITGNLLALQITVPLMIFWSDPIS